MQETYSANGHAPATTPDRRRRAKAVCPLCLSPDRIDKVSNIVRSGRGRLVWDNGEVAHYESELSGLLDEPPPPKALPLHKTLLDAVPPLIVLGALLFILTLIRSQDYLYVPRESTDIARKIGLAWFGLLIPCVLVVRHLHARSSFQRDLPVWTQARRTWTGLYYCPRDDIVFSRDSYEFASPAEVESLLYPPVSVAPERLRELPAEAGGGS
jgi:hypothetical protein